MNHPFELELSDLESIELDFPEELTHEEAAKVEGGSGRVTTLALGEEGGCIHPQSPVSKFVIKPYPAPPAKPPKVTTQAIGEEGGTVYTTLAVGEEGGGGASGGELPL